MTKYPVAKTSILVVVCTFLLSTTTRRRPSSLLFVNARDSSNGIPRSTSRRFAASNGDGGDSSSSSSFFDVAPWNYSPQINDDGFLKPTYFRMAGEWEQDANIGGKHGYNSKRYKQLQHLPVRIRQVPGDGNCLFHSISTCMSWIQNKTHVSATGTDKEKQILRDSSSYLRQCAVDCLERNPRRLLFLQGDEYMRAQDLVDSAAAQYDLSGDRYCELMRLESYWGGGPEIVALCNVLRRPIHVYELHDTRESSSQQLSLPSSEDDAKASNRKNSKKQKQDAKTFCLRRMACFGSPKFDRREPIHILSADSRFPDITPGNQLASGNHFLAMFPLSHDDVKKMKSNSRGSAVARGGSASIRTASSSSSSAAAACQQKQQQQQQHQSSSEGYNENECNDHDDSLSFSLSVEENDDETLSLKTTHSKNNIGGDDDYDYDDYDTPSSLKANVTESKKAVQHLISRLWNHLCKAWVFGS